MIRRKQKPKDIVELFGHTRKRTWERYGIQLDKAIYKDLCRIIQTGGAKLLYCQSNSRSIYKVPLDGKFLIVVYDHSRRMISTALPKEAEFDFAEKRETQTEAPARSRRDNRRDAKRTGVTSDDDRRYFEQLFGVA